MHTLCNGKPVSLCPEDQKKDQVLWFAKTASAIAIMAMDKPRFFDSRLVRKTGPFRQGVLCDL